MTSSDSCRVRISYARGKVDLFADLVVLARCAIRDDDDILLGRILAYVHWAATQNAAKLSSAVDLAFFLPVFRDPELCAHLAGRLPHGFVSAKWRLLMENSGELPEE
jgi:hypothetical protein